MDKAQGRDGIDGGVRSNVGHAVVIAGDGDLAAQRRHDQLAVEVRMRRLGGGELEQRAPLQGGGEGEQGERGQAHGNLVS